MVVLFLKDYFLFAILITPHQFCIGVYSLSAALQFILDSNLWKVIICLHFSLLCEFY